MVRLSAANYEPMLNVNKFMEQFRHDKLVE